MGVAASTFGGSLRAFRIWGILRFDIKCSICFLASALLLFSLSTNRPTLSGSGDCVDWLGRVLLQSQNESAAHIHNHKYRLSWQHTCPGFFFLKIVSPAIIRVPSFLFLKQERRKYKPISSPQISQRAPILHSLQSKTYPYLEVDRLSSSRVSFSLSMPRIDLCCPVLSISLYQHRPQPSSNLAMRGYIYRGLIPNCWTKNGLTQ